MFLGLYPLPVLCSEEVFSHPLLPEAGQAGTIQQTFGSRRRSFLRIRLSRKKIRVAGWGGQCVSLFSKESHHA